MVNGGNKDDERHMQPKKQQFPATLEALAEVLGFVTEYARTAGVEGLVLQRLELVAEELFVNICRYAYPTEQFPNGPGPIDIRMAYSNAHMLEMVVTDYGVAYDPIANAKEIDVDAPLEERTIGGYGVYFICKIMDDVVYTRKDDANVLTMTKKISPS